MSETICPTCHTAQYATAKFCSHCGATLQPATSASRRPTLLKWVLTGVAALLVVSAGVGALGWFQLGWGAEYYNNQAIKLSRKRDYDGAIQLFTKAIEMKSDKQYAYYAGRASTYAEKGDLDMAIADYDQTIAMEPSHWTAIDARGLLHLQKGAVDQAINDFTEALSYVPSSTTYHYHRGLAYQQKGDRAKAIADFRKAVELDGGDSDKAREQLKKLGVN
ncbi:MAG TPA: tetratricopeptide repeat protein [Symbiobacteriaceae bacterium]|nr:tetratricopeptide repeat protein [Symbiobacteriaceae bacterium]